MEAIAIATRVDAITTSKPQVARSFLGDRFTCSNKKLRTERSRTRRAQLRPGSMLRVRDDATRRKARGPDGTERGTRFWFE